MSLSPRLATRCTSAYLPSRLTSATTPMPGFFATSRAGPPAGSIRYASIAAPSRRFEEIAIAFPSGVHVASQLLTLPPSVSWRIPVPSGRTTAICEFRPPPGASWKAIHLPSGDQSIDVTGSSSSVTWSGQPPSAETTQICGKPLMFERKATCLPSGDSDGEFAKPIRAIVATVRSRSSASAVDDTSTRSGSSLFMGISSKSFSGRRTGERQDFLLREPVERRDRDPAHAGHHVELAAVVSLVLDHRAHPLPHGNGRSRRRIALRLQVLGRQRAEDLERLRVAAAHVRADGVGAARERLGVTGVRARAAPDVLAVHVPLDAGEVPEHVAERVLAGRVHPLEVFRGKEVEHAHRAAAELPPVVDERRRVDPHDRPSSEEAHARRSASSRRLYGTA